MNCTSRICWISSRHNNIPQFFALRRIFDDEPWSSRTKSNPLARYREIQPPSSTAAFCAFAVCTAARSPILFVNLTPFSPDHTKSGTESRILRYLGPGTAIPTYSGNIWVGCVAFWSILEDGEANLRSEGRGFSKFVPRNLARSLNQQGYSTQKGCISHPFLFSI